MDSKITQGQLLAECFGLIIENKVCPETKPREWLTVLLYMHTKGWLYFSGQEKLDIVACAYRIPAVSPEYTDVLPKKEKGNILYVPFYTTRNQDRFSALKFLKAYLKQNKQKIKEVAWYERGDNKKLKRYKIDKGVKNVKI